MSVQLDFTLTVRKLTPGGEYRVAFDWQGADGGESGYTSEATADDKGRFTFDLNPEVLVAVAQTPGPGTLTLSAVNADLSELGPGFTVTVPIA